MIGESVSHYRILEELGQGGMGVVYKAEDTRLRRLVALKFLPRELTSRDEARRRFVQEARIAAALDHPNICMVHEIDETPDRQLFLCMAFCSGQTLRTKLEDGPLEAGNAAEIAGRVARGLIAAHEHGIVHRDIKPANLMLTDDGEVKILDFGVAKQLGQSTLTVPGHAVGTVAYMSPEQVEGRPVDGRTDIWSLGVVLYEMVTGELPFSADSTAALLHAICRREPGPLPEAIRSSPLGRIILRCLAKDPDHRYESAEALLQDLRTVPGVAIPPPIHLESGRPRKWRVSSVGLGLAFAAIALASGLIVWVTGAGKRGAEEHSVPRPPPALAVAVFQNLDRVEDPERLGEIVQDLLITDLSGETALKIISSQRLFDVQKQMGYDARTRADREMAGRVAKRAGADRLLSGSILRQGERWILTCQLVDLDLGTVLESQRIEGDDLFSMTDDLSRRVRENLSIEAPGVPDVSVRARTTTDMEAYRHYLSGVEHLNASSLRPAIAEFQRAVEIDPTFNQAYYKMALAQWWSDDPDGAQGRASIEKILQNRQYTTERDRLLAEGALALFDRRYTDALQIYEGMKDRYPDDKEVFYVLGLAAASESNMDPDRARDAFRRAIELDPTFMLAYEELCDSYMRVRNYDLVDSLATKAVSIMPDSPVGYRFLAGAALCRGDSLRLEAVLDEALRHQRSPQELQGLYRYLGSVCNRISDEERSEYYTRRALEAYPDTRDVRIYAQLGDALYNQGRIDEAANAWRTGLKWNPLSSWCLGGLWYVAIHQRKFDEAIDLSRRLVEIRPQDPRRYAELLTGYVFSRRYTEAESVLTGGLAVIPSGVGKIDFLMQSSNVFQSNQRWDLAREALRRAAAVNPRRPPVTVLAGLALVANRERDYASAEEYARRALAEDSQDIGALRELFLSLLHGGKLDQALTVAAKRIADRPGDGRSYGDLAEAYIVTGRYEEADSLLVDALAVTPLSFPRSEAYFHWGRCYQRAGRYDRAEELFEAAVHALPDRAPRWDVLGFVCEMEGKFEKARTCYANCLADRPGDPRPAQLMGHLYLSRGDLPEAVRWYRRALESDEGDPPSLRGLAYILCEQGRAGEARPLAQRALDNERSFFSYATLAWVLIRSGDGIERGMDLARIALRTPPPDDPTDEYLVTAPFVPLPDHSLGLAYVRRGEFEKAVSHLERAAALRPEAPRILEDLRHARELAARSVP